MYESRGDLPSLSKGLILFISLVYGCLNIDEHIQELEEVLPLAAL